MHVAVFLLSAFCVAASLEADRFREFCGEYGRIPLVCNRSACHPLTHSAPSQRLIEASYLHRVSEKRALQLLESMLSSAKADHGPVADILLQRGQYKEHVGRIDEALCDFQASFAKGNTSASKEFARLFPRAQAEGQNRLNQLRSLAEGFPGTTSRGVHHSTLARYATDEWRYDHVHHSTAIEGNPLTYVAAKSAIQTRMVPYGVSYDSVHEVLNTDTAYLYVLSYSGFLAPGNEVIWNANRTSGGPLTLEFIKEIHRRVLAGHVNLDAPGKWRTALVRVADHVAPPPDLVPSLMEDLAARWQSAEFEALHPIEQAALAHFELVWVHPFEDGNGRTARLLSSYLLMRAGYPPLNVRISNRDAYYQALSLSHPCEGGCTRLLVQLCADWVEELLVPIVTKPPILTEVIFQEVAVNDAGEQENINRGEERTHIDTEEESA